MATKWHLIGQVRASAYRERTLLALERTMTPSQLHASVKTIGRPHITRALRELRALKLVRLLNPETPRHHLYARTKLGNDVAKAITRLQR